MLWGKECIVSQRSGFVGMGRAGWPGAMLQANRRLMESLAQSIDCLLLDGKSTTSSAEALPVRERGRDRARPSVGHGAFQLLQCPAVLDHAGGLCGLLFLRRLRVDA